MKLTTRIAGLAGVALLSIAAVACSGAAAQTDGDGTPGGADEPLPPGIETVVEPAPVLEAEVVTLAAGELGVRVLAEIGDGCHAYEATAVSREGDTIGIAVTRTAPAHPEVVLCTMQYQTHEETVALGREFEPGRRYTVVVNGERTLSFSSVSGG